MATPLPKLAVTPAPCDLARAGKLPAPSTESTNGSAAAGTRRQAGAMGLLGVLRLLDGMVVEGGPLANTWPTVSSTIINARGVTVKTNGTGGSRGSTRNGDAATGWVVVTTDRFGCDGDTQPADRFMVIAQRQVDIAAILGKFGVQAFESGDTVLRKKTEVPVSGEAAGEGAITTEADVWAYARPVSDDVARRILEFAKAATKNDTRMGDPEQQDIEDEARDAETDDPPAPLEDKQIGQPTKPAAENGRERPRLALIPARVTAAPRIGAPLSTPTPPSGVEHGGAPYEMEHAQKILPHTAQDKAHVIAALSDPQLRLVHGSGTFVKFTGDQAMATVFDAAGFAKRVLFAGQMVDRAGKSCYYVGVRTNNDGYEKEEPPPASKYADLCLLYEGTNGQSISCTSSVYFDSGGRSYSLYVL